MRTFLALLLILARDEKKQVDVVCPLDGAKFAAFEVVATNEWGGVDLDFCPHAFKTTPLEFTIWICPSCAFAGRKKDFNAKLSEEEKKALRAGLKPAAEIRKNARQTEIPGHVKYDLLAQVFRIRKAGPEEIGRACLNASWSCRQQGAVALDAFDEWETLRDGYGLNRTPMELGTVGSGKDKKMKNRTEYELEIADRIAKDIEAAKYKGTTRTLALYLLAYLYRKHGENGEAERRLVALDKAKGDNSVVDDAVAKMRLSITREREFQKQAIEGFAAAFETAASDKVAYLLGELHRRIGEGALASSWYQKAIDLTSSDALRKLASAQKSRLAK